MRVVPTSATTTSMQYDVYRLKGCSDAVFNEVDVAYKQVSLLLPPLAGADWRAHQIESEDKFLCVS